MLPITLLVDENKLVKRTVMMDKESRAIVKVIATATEPLETKEIEGAVKNVSRSKILYRLNNLRADGVIKGKQVGSGKRTWIWWKTNVFK